MRPQAHKHGGANQRAYEIRRFRNMNIDRPISQNSSHSTPCHVAGTANYHRILAEKFRFVLVAMGSGASENPS